VVRVGKKISGTAWDIYLYILTTDKPTGIREVWRALNLSSPSLVQYHINKLLGMKLIEATPEGKYQANDLERMGVLRNFVMLRGKLVPRLVFYGALILGILIMYLLFWPFRFDFRDLVVLLVTVFSATAFLFEAYNQYKGLIEQ
jgi:hypothetical protein